MEIGWNVVNDRGVFKMEFTKKKALEVAARLNRKADRRNEEALAAGAVR